MTRATRSRALRLSAGAAALALAAACGTTVPLSQRQSGLTAGAGAPAGGVSGGVADAAAGGLATAAPAETAAGGTTVAPGAAPGASGAVAGAPAGAAAGVGAATGTAGSVAGPGGATAPAATRRPGASTTTSPVRSTAPAKGGKGGAGAPIPGTSSRDTTPLKIGFVFVDAGSAAAVDSAAGVSTGTTVTPKQVMESLISYDNAHGGLAGRQVSLVEVAENGSSPNFSSDAGAACQTFTVDKPVPVVIDFTYGGGSGFDSCLGKAGVEDLTVAVPSDAATLDALPYEVATQLMTPDRGYSAAVTELAKTGYLTGSSKLGVFLDACPTSKAAYNTTVLPTIKRLGLTVAKTYTATCIAGEGGLGQAGSDTSSAVLQFRAAGVDRVMMVTGQDSTFYILFNEAADSQGYAPGYVMTSDAQPVALEMNFAASQKPNMHGAGNLPALDTDKPKIPGTPAEAACDADAKAGGAPPTTGEDYYYVSAACGPLALLGAALATDGGNATAPVLSKAITALGTSFDDPGVLGGAADLSHQDAPADVSVFGYDTGCSCLKYTTAPAAA